MSVIATVSVPGEHFVLGAALASDPEVRIRLERIVPTGDRFLPYLWIHDGDPDAVETLLRDDADVESFAVLDAVGDETLVRVAWSPRADGLLAALDETGAAILDGYTRGNDWRLDLRFDEHDELTSFYRACTDRDIYLDIERIFNPGPPREVASLSLTDSQREALVTALDAGYFDVPRGANLVDLAERMGISDSAVSQRIRRGLTEILSETLGQEAPDQRGDE